jgi:hypothetical protein
MFSSLAQSRTHGSRFLVKRTSRGRGTEFSRPPSRRRRYSGKGQASSSSDDETRPIRKRPSGQGRIKGFRSAARRWKVGAHGTSRFDCAPWQRTGKRWYSGGRQQCRPPFSMCGTSVEWRVALPPGKNQPRSKGGARRYGAGSPCHVSSAQTKLTVVLRRRNCMPTTPRPPIIIAQVAGSGTAGAVGVALIESVAPASAPTSKNSSSRM